MKHNLLILLLCLLWCSIADTAGAGKISLRHTSVTIIHTHYSSSKKISSIDTPALHRSIDIKRPFGLYDIYSVSGNYGTDQYIPCPLLPAGGFLHTAQQDSDCNWKIYPQQVICCEYDDRNRVKSMGLQSSGSMNSCAFKYEGNSAKLKWAKDINGEYRFTYTRTGDLSTITVSSYKGRDDYRLLYR